MIWTSIIVANICLWAWPPSNQWDLLWGRVEATKYGNCASSKTGWEAAKLGSGKDRKFWSIRLWGHQFVHGTVKYCKFQEVHCLRNGLSLCFHKVKLFLLQNLSCQILQISENNITTGLGCSQDCAKWCGGKKTTPLSPHSSISWQRSLVNNPIPSSYQLNRRIPFLHPLRSKIRCWVCSKRCLLCLI